MGVKALSDSLLVNQLFWINRKAIGPHAHLSLHYWPRLGLRIVILRFAEVKNDMVLGGVWDANDSTECVIYSVRAGLVWMRPGGGEQSVSDRILWKLRDRDVSLE